MPSSAVVVGRPRVGTNGAPIDATVHGEEVS